MEWDKPPPTGGFIGAITYGLMVWAIVEKTGADPEEVYDQLMLNISPTDIITPALIYQTIEKTARQV